MKPGGTVSAPVTKKSSRLKKLFLGTVIVFMQCATLACSSDPYCACFAAGIQAGGAAELADAFEKLALDVTGRFVPPPPLPYTVEF